MSEPMAPMDEMTCRELVELITDYLENALTLAEHARFEAHLEECDECTSYLGQMRQTLRVVGRLSENGLAPDAEVRLLAAFREWKRGS
jgi:predicted anti-sigma-YlaC factor YlaD